MKLKLIITAIWAGAGALIGKILSYTDLGKEMERNMKEAWEKYGKKE